MVVNDFNKQDLELGKETAWVYAGGSGFWQRIIFKSDLQILFPTIIYIYVKILSLWNATSVISLDPWQFCELRSGSKFLVHMWITGAFIHVNSLNPHNNPVRGTTINISFFPDFETKAQSAYLITVTGLGAQNTKENQADTALSWKYSQLNERGQKISGIQRTLWKPTMTTICLFSVFMTPFLFCFAYHLFWL